jgi:hypothetical protein
MATPDDGVDDEEDFGMAEAMMARGSYLRKLRALAEADELERANEQEEQSSSSEDVILTLSNGDRILRYNSYLSHQRYYDDLKHVDCDYIDYGSGVAVQQQKSLGKGGLCWDAAFILAEHLIETGAIPTAESSSETTTIVELGAGTGICGLLLAKYVACHVEITDLPSLMHLMERNVTLNFGAQSTIDDLLSSDDQHILYGGEPSIAPGTCEARVLEWGPQPATQTKYSIILGADVVASLYDPVALAETIHGLSLPETQVYISYKGRLDGPHERFEKRIEELYTNVERRVSPQSRNKNPGVYILHAKDPIF